MNLARTGKSDDGVGGGLNSWSGQLDVICDRFDAAWGAGHCPQIAEYLKGLCGGTTIQRRQLLLELVVIDLEYRWRQNVSDEASPGNALPVTGRSKCAPASSGLPQRPRLEDYAAAFPELGPLAELSEDFIEHEYRVRHCWGDHPSHDEYRARFAQYGPGLEQLLGRIDEELAQRPRSPQFCGAEPQPDREERRSGASIGIHQFRGTARFIPQERIGTGGMGVVYRVFDRERNEVVALKTLRDVDPVAIYRLKREFRALADLDHPNLVRFYELFFEVQQWFFSMEFVPGVDLLRYVQAGFRPGLEPPDASSEPSSHTGLSAGRAEIESRNPAPAVPKRPGSLLSGAQWQRLQLVFGQLVEAISFLHRQGLLHRDIKPSNVLVTRQGRVVVLDFGLATDARPRAHQESTKYQVLGTVLYMSPEQAAGRSLSPATDWYSVGAVLYEALTGSPPFAGNLDVLVAKQMGDPPEPRQLVPGIPEGWNALCMALLRRNPQDRATEADIRGRLGIESKDLPGEPSLPPTPVARVFVGRRRQLDELVELLSAVERGRTRHVFVRGESGIGKSTLVEQFLEGIASRRDVVVLAGRCHEHESVPFKGLDSLMDALAHYLVHLPPRQLRTLLPTDTTALWRVFPVLRRMEAILEMPEERLPAGDRQELRRRAFAALHELLKRIGQQAVLVLYIDDLQWSDLDSAVALRDLLYASNAPTLLFVACYRQQEEETSPVLRAILQQPSGIACPMDLRYIDVDPLSAEETRELVQFLAAPRAPLSAAQCESLARESRGHPYFLDALVRHHRARIQSGEALPPTAVSLEEALWAQVASLPKEARQILEYVALAGHPLRQGDAMEAAGVPNGRSAIERLRAARLVQTAGSDRDSQIAVYHDRIRVTMAANVSPDRLAACHLRLAQTLESSRAADRAIVAEHYLAVGQRDKAGECFRHAADAAADALAFDRAADLYQSAIELLPASNPDRRTLRYRLADALANAGRSIEAAERFVAAAHDSNRDEAMELLRRASMQFLMGGKLEEGIRTLRSLLSMAGIHWPLTTRRALGSLLWQRTALRAGELMARRALRAGLDSGRNSMQGRSTTDQKAAAETLQKLDLLWSVSVGLSMFDPVRAADFQARGMRLALRCREPYRLARGLATEAIFSTVTRRRSHRRVEQLLEQAKALAQQTDEPHILAIVSAAIAITAYMEGSWKRSLDYCERAEQAFRQQASGIVWEGENARTFALSKAYWFDTVQEFVVLALHWSGVIAELDRQLSSLMAKMEKRGNIWIWARLGMLVLPLLAADAPDQAEHQLHRCASRLPEGFGVPMFYVWFGQLQIELWRGNAERAWQLVEQRWTSFDRSLPWFRVLRIFAYHARARCALACAAKGASRETFLKCAQRDARQLSREPVAWAKPLNSVVRASIAVIRQQPGQAAQCLEEAIGQFDSAHMPLYAACARRRLGNLLGGNAGGALSSEAEAWMASQNIRNPCRMTALWIPGIDL